MRVTQKKVVKVMNQKRTFDMHLISSCIYIKSVKISKETITNYDKKFSLFITYFRFIKNLLSLLDGNYKSLWRNRLARSAVNRKVGGSSPPRDDPFVFRNRWCL